MIELSSKLPANGGITILDWSSNTVSSCDDELLASFVVINSIDF